MIKASIAFTLTLLLLIAAGPVAGQELIKEGSGEGRNVYTGTFNAIPMGKERVQMNYEVFGLVADSAPGSPFQNATYHCLGALHAVKGLYDNDFGFCSYTRPDGDMLYITYEATGKLGGQGGKGTVTIVGGTGKCAGIQGGGEFDRLPGFRPSAKGTFQGINKSKVNWKIP